jgi:hypothetical protein
MNRHRQTHHHTVLTSPDSPHGQNRRSPRGALMDMRTTLARARDLLTPSGEIAVVGLSANESAWDWVWSACCVPVAAVGDRLHGDTPDIGVTLADPRESLRTIRRMTAEVLPGAVIRRKLYYRYLLRWSSGPSGR